MTEILEISRTRYYTGKPYRQRALRAQWEYKHRALRTITHRVARRAVASAEGGRARERLSNLTRPETLTRPPISTPREYQAPMETVLSFEPLLMPSSGTGCCGARPRYACTREKRESCRNDDRLYGFVKIAPRIYRDVKMFPSRVTLRVSSTASSRSNRSRFPRCT